MLTIIRRSVKEARFIADDICKTLKEHNLNYREERTYLLWDEDSYNKVYVAID
jgi:hypothetical protein